MVAAKQIEESSVSSSGKLKNPSKLLRRLQGLEAKASAKEIGFGLIQRTLLITVYLIFCSLATILARTILAVPFLAGLLEVLLYSVLNAYYCYEYKTAALELDFLGSLANFEAQWAYFFGFGFLFTAGLYSYKELGSCLFFLFFPIMVVASLDEGGQGLLAYQDDRMSSVSLPLLSVAYGPQRWLIRRLNDYIVKT